RRITLWTWPSGCLRPRRCWRRWRGKAERLAARYNQGYTPTMKPAISHPDDFFSAAEELLKRLGMSRSELYAKAVAMFVKGHKSTRVKETLDAIYTTEDSRLDPALVALQALSLPKEKW